MTVFNDKWHDRQTRNQQNPRAVSNPARRFPRFISTEIPDGSGAPTDTLIQSRTNVKGSAESIKKLAIPT